METITVIYIGTLIIMSLGAVVNIFNENDQSKNKKYKIIYRKRFK